jgi:DNA/RNA-binding domain of Phe-tRNA-synthetase-like protein
VVAVDAHPLLEAGLLVVELPGPLGSIADDVASMLTLDGGPDLGRDEERRGAVRRLLRHGGFKPSGRNKPASEYLVKAADGGFLSPINAAVDWNNVASLHSGLPISVVDLDLVTGPLRIGVVEAGSYVFNAAGHELKLDGLLCLHDTEGPCANAVKDAQRTKTHDGTRRMLFVVWGTTESPGTEAVVDWLAGRAAGVGATATRP